MHQLRLGLDAVRVQYAHVRGARARVGQQRALADPRLPPQHQRAAPALAGAGQQRIDPRPLGLPADEHAATLHRCSIDAQ
jgi:hypothetical protein